jgi:glycosyltransferase involved in cell wall biosynthesis
MIAASMRISVVTPSRNMLGYLRRAAASVADQEGVDAEHVVMDACSTDGTREWLATQPTLSWSSEPDAGMYDAINKGIARSTGDVVGYLNCDEQYLPSTLARVAQRFEREPELDLLFGGALLIRPDGSLIAYRKAYVPRWRYVAASHLYVLSCTMFFRRRLLERGLSFDASYKAVADARFVIDALRAGARVGVHDFYHSAFTMTGENLGAGAITTRETARMRRELPVHVRLLALPLNALRLAEKALSGAYVQSFPFSYEVYVGDALETRKRFTVQDASFRWREA